MGAALSVNSSTLPPTYISPEIQRTDVPANSPIRQTVCKTDDGLYLPHGSEDGCKGMLRTHSPLGNGTFAISEGGNTVYTKRFLVEHQCLDSKGASLGMVTNAAECEKLAVSKPTQGRYIVKFDGDQVSSVMFEPPAALTPAPTFLSVPSSPGAPTPTVLTPDPKPVAAPVEQPADKMIETSKAQAEIMSKLANEVWGMLQRYHAQTQSEYAAVDKSDSYALTAYNGGIQKRYIREISDEFKAIDEKYKPMLAALATKENFSQPDLGTVAGWSVFWILLLLILCIVLAVYFKVPAQLFKSARVDAKV